MLRVVAQKSSAAALKYYAEGLKREDYYAEGQEVAGKWHGKGAERLGLSGSVKREEFAALVENRHPFTGEKLTPRTKTDRRVGYDLNFHAPKSLSIVQALTGDERIVTAFREAVVETMVEIEAQAATRVRRRGEQGERTTGNLVWAEFVHFTSRPVGGIPDPHLHVHAYAMNSTFDEIEERWKAVSWAAIKKDAPYCEAAFHSRLASKVQGLGYGIDRTRFGWEVAGIPRDLIEKFSRRTAQIERLAAQKGIKNAKDKDALGASTREGKRRGLTDAELIAAWESRLTPQEKALITNLRPGGMQRPSLGLTPAQVFEEASEKLFAKSSVVEVRRLVAETLRFGVGSVSPAAAWQEFERREMVVRQVGGEWLCTSIPVLAEEVSLINVVRNGRGMAAPFCGKKISFRDTALSAEQRNAVRHILNSQDQVVGVRGAAGVGKTTLMREAVAQIEATGVRVFAFAPSASASRETMREAGFANAETVAHLLANTRLHSEIRGQVIWIDEAGLLGIRDLSEIMRIAGSSTRIILTGDIAQHAPVARGDAFRLIQHYSGLQVVEVTQIRRQEREEYRKAVAALSKGDLRTGFRRLEAIGAFVEIGDDDERYRVLAEDYLELGKRGRPPLVVSPTHAEGAHVTTAIREAKRQAGLLGPERSFVQYHNLRWEEPDKRRPENYSAGLVIQFHQNAKGVKRGELLRVAGRNENGEVEATMANGRKIALPLNDSGRFQVFEERELRLAKGDRIRITHGGKSADGRRLNNGNEFTITGFSRDGGILLNNGATLEKGHGHIAYGYVSTSHASQGKSVRDVLIAQSVDSFLAASREQFYVSVSRGKESIRIYTDDRRALEAAVGNSSTRQAGIELAGFSKREITGIMSAELNGRQWQDHIRSRKGNSEAEMHVRELLRARKDEAFKPSATMDFQRYVAMRRANAGPDGKSRSKGQPNFATQGKGSDQNGKSFLRPTQLTEPTRQKLLARQSPPPNEKQKQPDRRQGKIAKAYEAAKDHFQKVAGRVKSAADRIKPKRSDKQWPESKPDQISRHRMKQRNVSGDGSAKSKTQTQQKAPPAPAPRRTK